MTGHEFLARLKRLSRKTGVSWFFDPVQGAGSHGMVHYGGRFTTLKDRKKEIGPGLLASMLRDLGIRKQDF